MDKTVIVGAGLAGLIAACSIKNAPIYEAGKRVEQHKALMRFRDESVSNAIGIKFRPVRVHKSIYVNGGHYDRCNPTLANLYAKKVTGRLSSDRSIWNLDEVTRYIAPEDLYERLVHRHADRIEWELPLEQVERGQTKVKYVSTIPMPVMMKACGIHEVNTGELAPAAIEVTRYRVKGADVFQTVYFPDPCSSVFRASITGDLLIVERMTTDAIGVFAMMGRDDEDFEVLDAFGIDCTEIDLIESVHQKYGKIVELPQATREAILYELTREFNVFSLGRFATWRNILLDDVVKDVNIVQRLMQSSSYGRELVLARR